MPLLLFLAVSAGDQHAAGASPAGLEEARGVRVASAGPGRSNAEDAAGVPGSTGGCRGATAQAARRQRTADEKHHNQVNAEKQSSHDHPNFHMTYSLYLSYDLVPAARSVFTFFPVNETQGSNFSKDLVIAVTSLDLLRALNRFNVDFLFMPTFVIRNVSSMSKALPIKVSSDNWILNVFLSLLLIYLLLWGFWIAG